jgi:acyl-[acyl-carrier-protein] desaturase
MMLLLQKRSSSSSPHLHRLSWPRASTATATAICDEQQMMERLAEDGWVDAHMLPLLTPVEEAW